MIRPYTRFDYDSIFQMLCNYRDVSDIDTLKQANNRTHIDLLLNHILAGGGVGLVACKEQLPVGVLLALRTPIIWEPSLFQLSELVYWMEPEARKSRLGYLLLKEYVRIGQGMKKSGTIEAFTMTRRSGTGVNYARFGFKPVEENWSQ